MVLATNLGFPRFGAGRELKKAVEAYWKGKSTKEELQATAKELRLRHWKMQKDAGIQHVPCNDFAFYDQMLDMCCLLGCIPSRYNWKGGNVDIDTYFAMGRGNKTAPAMEMTKWFDTNYHYIVPELEEGVEFKISSSKVFDEFSEAKAAGIPARPVLIGPVTFIHLAKAKYENFEPKAVMEKLLPAYEQILQKLAGLGAEWVQIDEPVLATDICEGETDCFKPAYERLAKAAPQLKILVATYFDSLRDNVKTAFSLPVAALHIDLVRAPDQLDAALAAIPDTMSLSMGVIDGRNIWKANLDTAMKKVEKAVAKLVGSPGTELEFAL